MVPCQKDHRQRVVIGICHTTQKIDGSRSAGSIGAGTFFLRLRISAGCESCPLFIVTGMILCLRISLNGVYQMCDHGSLIAEEMADSFFLQKRNNII